MQTVEILLPKMGESVMEATIIEWHVSVGSRVEKDDALVTIGTDKVDSELPSEYSGTITQLLHQIGDVVNVGQAIAIIETNADVITKQPSVVSNHQNQQIIKETATFGVPKKLNHKFLSPVVRKIASQANLSLEEIEKIPTSGSNGRIKKTDIINYLNPKASNSKPKKQLNIQANDRVEPLSRIRSITAKHLLESYQNIPHVTTFALADVSNLVSFRDAHKFFFQEKKQTKVTYTHLMLYLMLENLNRYPMFNAWMDDDQLIIKHQKNIGFATATPDGNLIVPNIKDAAKLTFIEFANELNRISTLAKQHQLQAADVQDTTFTISNTGIFGSLMGTPIISAPQVAILALGEILDTPSAITKKNKAVGFEFRKKMYLSLSYDHRVIDGALASKFLTTFKNLLEKTDFNHLI